MKKHLLILTLLAVVFSFSAMSQCGQVGLIGEMTAWADDHFMDRNPESPDEFSTFIYLTDADDMSDPPDGIIEMKFRENADWAVNWGAPDFPSGTAVLDGDNIPVPVGNYYVTFNCTTLEYNFQETCGLIGMIGEFNEWAGDHFMTRDPMNPDSWMTTISFTEDDDMSDPPDGIIELKFRENADWTMNWGSPDFPSGTAVPDGDNIPVPIGHYKVLFNCATGDYEFIETCGEIGLIGEMTGWADDYWMMRDMADPDSWTVVLSLTEEDDMSDPPDGIIELKFRENSDWAMNWGSPDFPSGTAVQDGDNIPVPLDATGLTTDYYVTFNCVTGEYNFQATSGTISMIGAFVNWNGDIPMNRDAMDPDHWTLTRSWYEDSEVKFRENNDWSVNWGNSGWPSGIGEDNGPNIPLVAGTYDVIFNTGTLAYDFVSNPDVCGEIGMVGDFNNWGDDGSGVPADVYLVRDPMYPSQFSLEYNFTSSTGLLFRVDADATFQNVWGGVFPTGAWPCATGVFGDPLAIIDVPGGKYRVTFNCQSGDFCFVRLGNAVTASKVFAMTVDGNLDEADWDISQPVANVVDGTVVGALNEVYFGVTYNEEYLYVGIDVYDEALVGTEIGEVFVDGDKSGGAYDDFDVHIRFSGAGGIEVISGDTTMTPLLGFVVSPTFDGYTAEVGIPWADLGVTPEVGGQIGFDVMMGDDDTGTGIEYTVAWNGGMQNYESTSSFGDLLFGNLSCGCISMYNETTGDVELRNPTDMPTTYVGTYEMDADYEVVFRKDFSETVAWSTNAWPNGTAELGGDPIPGVTGRYRITFDCVTGEYTFVDESADEGVAYAQWTDDAVTIDGDLSEFSLDYNSEIIAAGTGPNNNTVVWGALWDAGSFYIGAQVEDAVVEGAGNPWDNDAIEFYMDGNHDEDGAYDSDFDSQLILDFVGQSVLWIKADGVPITDYESNWTATGSGYNVEMRVAWSNIDFFAGRNKSIGWSLGNNDSDNGIGRDYQTVWYGTGDNWNNTDDLGDLQLAGGPYSIGIRDHVTYEASFILYPNPSNGNTYLRTTGDIFDGEVDIYITDLTGRTVTIQNETIFGANNTIQLNTNQLESGIYFITVVAEDSKKAVKKLILQ